jgi:NADH-quinone oxidoreductase subunit I
MTHMQFVTGTREQLFYNKPKLLDNDDRWEPLLAKRPEIDAPYR